MKIQLGDYTVEIMATNSRFEDTSVKEDTMRFLCEMEGYMWDAMHYNEEQKHESFTESSRAWAHEIHDKLASLNFFKKGVD